MNRLELWLTIALVLLMGARTSVAAPPWGTNCLSCHDQNEPQTLIVFGEDGQANPDESETGAPDRGWLKVFQVRAGESKMLFADVMALQPDDGYAVELRRLTFSGVENGETLNYVADCDWAEWRQPGSHYSDPEFAYYWPTDPSTFSFEIMVEANASADYFDLIFAVAGRSAPDDVLFSAREHFYLQVLPALIPGDMDEDGDVDLFDFALFADCSAGPDMTSPPVGCDPSNFESADLDDDSDVDLHDFAAFQQSFTG